MTPKFVALDPHSQLLLDSILVCSTDISNSTCLTSCLHLLSKFSPYFQGLGLPTILKPEIQQFLWFLLCSHPHPLSSLYSFSHQVCSNFSYYYPVYVCTFFYPHGHCLVKVIILFPLTAIAGSYVVCLLQYLLSVKKFSISTAEGILQNTQPIHSQSS